MTGSQQSERRSQDEFPVNRCPECEKGGLDVRAKLDTRVLVNGRGLYICPQCRATWQDADEPQKFNEKDARLR